MLEPSWEVIQFNMNTKVFALACMAALAGAAPAADADAEADAQFLGYAGHHVAAPLAHAVAPVAVAPAPNCVTEDVILVTQVCTPAAEEVCSTDTGVGEVLGISLSIGLGLPLADVVGSDGSSNGSVTESVDDLSADLLVLDLLGGDSLGGADLLGSGGADLGDQDHVLGDTGGGRGSVVSNGSHRGGNSVSQRGGNVVASIAEELSVSLSIGISSRGGASEGSHTGKGENLRVHIELDDFPRWLEH